MATNSTFTSMRPPTSSLDHLESKFSLHHQLSSTLCGESVTPELLWGNGALCFGQGRSSFSPLKEGRKEGRAGRREEGRKDGRTGFTNAFHT